MGRLSDAMAEGVGETGFYPQQVGIDAYGKGGFRFADLSHRGSLLCLPTGMHAWNVSQPGEITLESLAPVFAAADAIDVLLFGLGFDIFGLPPGIREALRERQIIVEPIATGGAVRTYNVLLAEQRAVGAALLAVDKVR
ncbi:MAG: hypothetical protein JWR39_2711 [Devosia sp.]|jgi:uncharacterized protein|nr:hypothetical protein [Devosia sp.]